MVERDPIEGFPSKAGMEDLDAGGEERHRGQAQHRVFRVQRECPEDDEREQDEEPPDHLVRSEIQASGNGFFGSVGWIHGPCLRNWSRLATRDNRHRSAPCLEEREADGVTPIDKHSLDESPFFACDPIAMRVLRDDEVPSSEIIAEAVD